MLWLNGADTWLHLLLAAGVVPLGLLLGGRVARFAASGIAAGGIAAGALVVGGWWVPDS